MLVKFLTAFYCSSVFYARFRGTSDLQMNDELMLETGPRDQRPRDLRTRTRRPRGPRNHRRTPHPVRVSENCCNLVSAQQRAPCAYTPVGRKECVGRRAKQKPPAEVESSHAQMRTLFPCRLGIAQSTSNYMGKKLSHVACLAAIHFTLLCSHNS